MSLFRSELCYNKGNKLYNIGNYYESYKCCLECINLLPHSTEMPESEFTPDMILFRYKLEAFVNELIGKIYYLNSIKSLFYMSNAKNIKSMKSKSFTCFEKSINIYNKFSNEKELQLCYIRVIPNYLILLTQLQNPTSNEIKLHVLKIIEILKYLHNDGDIKKAESINKVLQLITEYCPNDTHLMMKLITDNLYYCSRNNKYNSNDSIKANELCINARTTLLKTWYKADWKFVLRILHKIAYKNISNYMINELMYIEKLKLNELPKNEIKRNDKYFKLKLKNDNDLFYGNAILIEKYANSGLISKAAKLLINIEPVMQRIKGDSIIYFKCLERLIIHLYHEK